MFLHDVFLHDVFLHLSSIWLIRNLILPVFGPDPLLNARLADLIQKAKRTGFAKASIESAILRGQGKSSTGASLEPITVECVLPSNIACIVECETESRLRTMADVKHAIKNAGGNASPCAYLFTKKGRIVFEAKEGVGLDHVFEPALEAGALDVDEEDGQVIVHTEPADTKATGETLSTALGLEIAQSDIFWDPNEDTIVDIPTESIVSDLASFMDQLESKEVPIQGVYMNISPSKEVEEGDAWADLMDRVSA